METNYYFPGNFGKIIMALSVIGVVIFFFVIQESDPIKLANNNLLTMREFLMNKGVLIQKGDPTDKIYEKIYVRVGKPPKNWNKYPSNISARWISKGKEPSDDVYYLFLFPVPQPSK